MAVKTLDFSKFLKGSTLERQEMCNDLVDSFKKSGFVKLVNHGVPEETVQNYQSVTKEFFDLPVEVKRKCSNVAGPHPQRGWSFKGAEQTGKLRKENIKGREGEDLLDEREFFDAGPPQDHIYPNKWPTEALPSFQPLMETCYRTFQDVCLQIMEAMEIGLGMPAGTLSDRSKPAASEIRLNHYPAIETAKLSGNLKRTWPHTDFGIITLLFQDNVGGLELEDRENPGTFIPVVPGSPNSLSEMVVNVSDTFQRWTNDVIPAGVHRVDIPPSVKDGAEKVCPARYSSIFFFKADRNMSVGPLPCFVTAENPARYDDITALEFQQLRTQILY